jgi:DNA-binding MarR family transcriptional regulator
LGQLERAGLLVRLPKVGDERRVYYERVERILGCRRGAAREIAVRHA